MWPRKEMQTTEQELDPMGQLAARDKKYKTFIRRIRLASRIISLVLSCYVIGSLSYSLAKYLATRNTIVAGNQRPWATPTKLWPTLMLLVIAALTVIMNAVTLASYLCGVDSANRMNNIFSYIGYAVLATHLVAWAAAMGLFNAAQDGSDLWSYACGDVADALQNEVQAFLDFGQLCTVQTGAWWSSVLQAINYALSFLSTALSLVRLRHKKKMVRVATGLSETAGTNLQAMEVGTVDKA